MNTSISKQIQQLADFLGVFLMEGSLLGKDDVARGVWKNQCVILRSRKVPIYQPLSIDSMNRLPDWVSIPLILQQGVSASGVPYYIEADAGATWFDEIEDGDRFVWPSEAEQDVVIDLYWQTRVFWTTYLPHRFGLMKDPAVRVRKWLHEAESSGVRCSPMVDRVEALFRMGLLEYIPFEASHGHTFCTHLIGDRTGLVLLEFDKVGFYVQFYDLVMDLWYRWLHLPEVELDLELFQQRLDSFVLRSWSRRGENSSELKWVRELKKSEFVFLVEVALLFRMFGSMTDIAHRIQCARQGVEGYDLRLEQLRLAALRSLCVEYSDRVEQYLREL